MTLIATVRTSRIEIQIAGLRSDQKEIKTEAADNSAGRTMTQLSEGKRDEEKTFGVSSMTFANDEIA